eukprot:jgi/Chlat1/5820/Chrsp4S00483
MDYRGVASLAFLPSGQVSGHFVDAASRSCFGLVGHELPCERECSHGEDHRLLSLAILDFATNKERRVVVEQSGSDAAKFATTSTAHGWDEEVVRAASEAKSTLKVSFRCRELKADADADAHLQKTHPRLVGRGAVVNIGPMTIEGLAFSDAESDAFRDGVQ